MDKNQQNETIFNLEKIVMKLNKEQLDLLLSDNFVEFGSSGNVYSKKDQLSTVVNSSSQVDYKITDFKGIELAPGVILATYKTKRFIDNKVVLRSSIWKLNNGQWQMLFHQGTPTK